MAGDEDEEAVTDAATARQPRLVRVAGRRPRTALGGHPRGRPTAAWSPASRDTTTVAGVGHISAIAVHADARGRGLGPSITAWAMRRLFAEGRDVVTLGVYSDNTVGRRMY